MSNIRNHNLLFISNGYGEDIVSAHIAKQLRENNSSCAVSGFPTVGPGKFYNTMGIECAGKGAELLSEGFVRSPKDLITDIRDGFISKTYRMGRSLGKTSKNYNHLIVVGDPYLLLYTSIFTPHKRKNKIFIGIQQSEWYGTKKPFKQHYSFIERLWMKWCAGLIYVRDEKTRDYLRTRGLHSVRSHGNPMMDCFTTSNKRVLPHNRDIIGVLPGSKQEAYENLSIVFEIIRHLSKTRRKFHFAIALSPHLDSERIVNHFNLQRKHIHSIKGQEVYQTYELAGLDTLIFISKTIFGDIISESKGIIGVSGTGNEQAAGLGKPVFAFWGQGPQITKKFMIAQQRLLGKSLLLCPPRPEAVSKTIIETLDNPSLLKEIEENGRMRMAGIGSIKHMVADIEQFIQGDG